MGDFLSPAFGTNCANQAGAAAAGGAASAPSTTGGNALGVPLTGPLNHCGGADAANAGMMIAAGLVVVAAGPGSVF
ncbi:hypothetical protein [Streptomyces lavendofoliae]|uniref:hypothetical protein n=1 Tax=Streptomyces lavendofoliae TaxID=67314 RepID=UPI003D8C0437